MIIWLASYPRSGNTLMREILWNVFSTKSVDIHVAFSPDPKVQEIYRQVDTGSTQEVHDAIRHLTNHQERRHAAYRFMHESADQYVVKTHNLPSDDSPAIYVMRDGRRSIVSYQKFLNDDRVNSALGQNLDRETSLLDLILGSPRRFSNWSQHVSAWTRRGNTVTFKFEDLVKPDSSTVDQIGNALGGVQAPKQWDNPLEKRRSSLPGFFGEGQIAWKAPDDWSPLVDAAFTALHGETMCQHGYLTANDTNSDTQDAQFWTQLKTYVDDTLSNQTASAERISKLRRSVRQRNKQIERLNRNSR